MEGASFLENIDIIWLLFGALLMAIEVIFIPGVGFLFGGLAALTIGIAVARHWLPYDDYIMQFGWFFAAAILWTILLWYPLKRFLKHPHSDFSNIVGSTAVVLKKPLTKEKRGVVKWSGTNMSAILDTKSEADLVPVGEEVEVVRTKGNMLIVCPLGDLPSILSKEK